MLALACDLALCAKATELMETSMAMCEHLVGELQKEKHLSSDGPLANLF